MKETVEKNKKNNGTYGLGLAFSEMPSLKGEIKTETITFQPTSNVMTQQLKFR